MQFKKNAEHLKHDYFRDQIISGKYFEIKKNDIVENVEDQSQQNTELVILSRDEKDTGNEPQPSTSNATKEADTSSRLMIDFLKIKNMMF